MSDTTETTQEVSPTAAAQKHAEALGIDIPQIGGTGKDGAVTKADIEKAIAARPELLAAEQAQESDEVKAVVTRDAVYGTYLVQVTINHPDETVITVNGRAVWKG
jgi:pyruvate/2-oxoglutarate dehydrogenase complex dihydrolipoamide acyltransferase (E2) component